MEGYELAFALLKKTVITAELQAGTQDLTSSQT